MAGISVADECMVHYEELKMKRKYSFLIFRMSDDLREVVVDKAGEPGPDVNGFEEMSQSLLKDTQNECRYAVCPFHYKVGGQARTAIIFVYFSPEGSSIKDRMIFSATKASLMLNMSGLSANINAHNAADLDFLEIQDKLTRGGKKA